MSPISLNGSLPPKPASGNNNKKRGQTIVNWWTGKGPTPQAFATNISSEGHIFLTSLRGEKRSYPRYLSGGLGSKARPCWIEFETDGNNKLVHVFEQDKRTAVNSFYLVKEGRVLKSPEAATKSEAQLSHERGRVIADWWAGKGRLPPPFASNITNTPSVFLTTLKKRHPNYLTGDLGKERPCWLVFEEAGQDKYVHLFEADKKTMINSFFLIKDGQALDDPEPLLKSTVQIARERGRGIVAWWTADGPIPSAFEYFINGQGIVNIAKLDGKQRMLAGGLKGKRRPCWLTFEETGKDKLVHVLEEDKTTKLNSFYLVKDGQIIKEPEPVFPSHQKTSRVRGDVILEWCTAKEGTPPQAFESNISKEGKIVLIYREVMKVTLAVGPGKARPCWIEFEEDGENKIAHIFEGDRTTLINSFFLVRDGQILTEHEPRKTIVKSSLKRSGTIIAWWTGTGSIPQSCETSISNEGRVTLTFQDGKKSYLTGGLKAGKRLCRLEFEAAGNNKLVHVSEQDGTRLNSFYLVRNGKILAEPEPAEESPALIARKRGRAVADWWLGKGPIPQSFELSSLKGAIQLTSLKGKQRTLAIGSEYDKCRFWLEFEADGNNKYIHVFEADRAAAVKSFFLVKDGRVLDNPEPLIKSSAQLGRERNRGIIAWWTAIGPLPPAFATNISKNGRIMLAIKDDKKGDLIGGLGEGRPCWIEFEATGNNKLVHVLEADKTTPINSFYLVKDGQVLKSPDPVTRSVAQITRERGRAIIAWWTAAGSLPTSFTAKISNNMRIVLVGNEAKKGALTGGLGQGRPCWIEFEAVGNNKLVHAYETDKKTRIKSFYFVKDGHVLESPEPVTKSPAQIAHEKGKVIIAWWLGNGPAPQSFSINSNSNGSIDLVVIKGKLKSLRGLGRRKRPCRVVFEAIKDSKLVHVFEQDQTTLTNSFYLIKNGLILESPEIVKSSDPESGVGLTGPTPRQRLRLAIANIAGGRSNYDEVAALYSEQLFNLASYWVTLARHSLLLDLRQSGVLPPFQDEVSLGSGPSTSYLAWRNLAQTMNVTDVDSSQAMLRAGPNEQQLLADIAQPLPLPSASFDLSTMDSAIRYIAPERRFFALSEASRVLKSGGIFSLTQLGYLFDQDFAASLQQNLGFNVLTPPDYHMSLTRSFWQQLNQEYPAKVAATIRHFLDNCGVLIAVKQADPSPEPKSLPLFNLQRIRGVPESNGSYDGNITVGPEDFSLGQFDQLIRSRLKIKDINVQETDRKKAGERLRQALSRTIPALTVEVIVAVVLEFSPEGSLLEIAEDKQKLTGFNARINHYGYQLNSSRAGAVLTRLNQ